MIFTSLADWILGMLPDSSFNADFNFFTVLRDVLNWIAFLLPLDDILAILGIIGILMVYRVFVSLVRTMFNLIPFM